VTRTATLKLVHLDGNGGDTVLGKPIIVRKRSSAPQLTEAEARRLRERVANLAIGFVPTAEVVANPRNAKRHPRRQVEFVAVYVAGDMPTADKFRFGERRRLRSNVWSYAGAKCSHQDEATAATLKPVALVVDALRDSSRAGQIVLDPFGGIGTTMIAAERSGRRAHLIEIDPIYCDLIVRRWQTFSGKVAHLAESIENFADVQARRIRADADQE
jgi:hypothetical protein